MSGIRNRYVGLSAYALFWFGQLVSFLGSSIVQFVLIWWITITTQSAFYLGLGSFLAFGTMTVIMPFAGVLVDRWPRKLVLAGADGLQALVTLGVIYLFYINRATVGVILIMITIRGILAGFHSPAFQAVIPLLVPAQHLEKINSLGFVADALTNIIGPILGAVVINIFTIERMGDILWIDMLTFLVALLPLIFIAIPFQGKDEESTYFEELKQGVSYLKNHQFLFKIIIGFSVMNLFATSTVILLPLIISSPNYFNGNENLLSWMIVINQVGGIIGALFMTFYPIFKNHITGIRVGIMLVFIGAGLIGIGALFINIIALSLGLAILGFGFPVALISAQTLYHKEIPKQLHGRVISASLFIAQIFAAIGMYLVGILAQEYGLATIILSFQVAGVSLYLLTQLFVKSNGEPLREQTLS